MVSPSNESVAVPAGLDIPLADWQQTPPSVQTLVVTLLQRLEALEARVSQDSRTSQRPPSADSPYQKPRKASASSAPRAGACSTQYSWTACPCWPARTPQAATVRALSLKAATMACTGPPCARNVTTVTTSSAAVRRWEKRVPWVTVKVLRHCRQMHRWS